MKTIHKFLFLFLLFSFSLLAQDLSITCNMSAGTPSTPYSATGGMYKPSANAAGQYFRVLIIFAEFEGDNSVISNWQYKSKPDWANNIIDQTPSSSYRSNTISDYFKKMSNGTFDVIGDIYDSVITVPTRQSYGSDNQYVLNALNSYNCNFKKYDNWGFNSPNFVFSAQNGDGYVDMIYIIYRWGDNSAQTGWIGLAGGIADLGFSSEITTHDGVKINGNGQSVLGSGITLNCNATAFDNFTIVGNFCHELGHYLFGAYHTNMGGIMMGYPAPYYGTYAMSGYERLLLGYITSISLPADGEQVTLRDYVTTGDILKIPVPINNPNSSTFFVVENHQRLSSYDQIMTGGSLEGVTNLNTTIGSGLYVWTIFGGNSYPANTDIKSGSGAWDWAYDGDYYAGPGWGLDKNDEGYLPEIKKSAVDRDYGESSRYYDLIQWHSLNAPKWVDTNPLTGQYEITRDVMGRESDAYNIGYNEVFSRWSNPSTYFSRVNDVAFQLLPQNGSDMILKICLSYNTALSLPPSKPQFLKTSSTADGHITLNWTANSEPDLYSYKIYKAITTGNEPTSYNYTATVSSSSTSWTDPTINTQSGLTKVFYKISSIDNSSQESIKSDYAISNCLNGQITSDISLPIGTYHCYSNVTVVSGVTLAIQTGTQLTFNNNSSLIVNGTLNIQGTSNSNAVLDFGSISLSPINGIFSYAGSQVNLSYAEIKNCAVGVWSSDAPLHIDHCNLHNMYKTVYFNNLNYNNYGSAITNSYLSNCTSEAVWLKYCLATLTNNKITNNSGEGVRLSSFSDATLNMNTIQNNHSGITLSSYCDAALSGHNLLANNAYDGIAGQMEAIITAVQGYNTFEGNNSYNIELYASSTAYAENNYWGAPKPDSNKFYTDGTSSINYSLWLTSDPGTGSSLPKTTTQQTDLNSAISYLSQGQFDMAEKLFKEVINNKLNSQECVYALSGLAACYRQSGNNGFRTYLENELRPRLTNTKDDLYRHYLELDSHCLINDGQYDGAINIHQQLRDNYQLDLETRKELDYDDALISLVYKGNKIEGKAKFDKMKTDYPDERTKHDIDIFMAAYNNRGYSLLKNAASQNNSGKNTNNIESIPTEYGLGQNYPNPFNPTTIIEYQLPKDGFVSLKVYDILGREIKALVNEYKTVGKYSVSFDGSNLASGIYFYQLRVNAGGANNIVLTKKMQLIK